MIPRLLVPLLAASLLVAPIKAQDSPLYRTAKAVRSVEVAPALAAVADPADPVIQGLSTVRLFGYLASGGELHSVELFPAGDAAVYRLEDLERIVWERDAKLGPLHVRTAIHYDKGATHVEGSILFANSESVSPVGDLKVDWIGLGVADGLGTFSARNPVAFGLEPVFLPNDPNVSTWKCSLATHIPGACAVPFPFVIGFGTHAQNARAYLEPDHLRRRGEFLIPSPVFDATDVGARRAQAKRAWSAFQVDRRARGNEAYLFGMSAKAGAAGDQMRLGKHPCMDATSPQIRSGYASDQLRSMALWEISKRRLMLDWPMVLANDPGSAYYFEGLHWSSRWKAGYTLQADRSWSPRLGSYSHRTPSGQVFEVTGYNLEHARSIVSELAFYTADPMLAWLTARTGIAIATAFASHPIEDGGYFGGGFSSLRGWLRPLVELMECTLALEAYGGPYDEVAAFLRARIALKLEQLREHHPRFAKAPTRPDEQIPGYEGEPISEIWQAGMGGDYLWSWYLLTGDPNALELAKTCLQLHLDGWRGVSAADLEMPKQVLAADWSIGRAYGRRHDFLVGWNLSLLQIGDMPGPDDLRRQMIVDAILSEYPGASWTKWGSGPWGGFQPLDVQAVSGKTN